MENNISLEELSINFDNVAKWFFYENKKKECNNTMRIDQRMEKFALLAKWFNILIKIKSI